MPLFTTPKRRCFALALGLVLATAWVWWRCARNPDVFFLSQQRGAEWIVYPLPPDGNLHRAANWNCTFQRTFHLDTLPANAAISWRAFRNATLSLNGQPVALTGSTNENWKLTRNIEITQWLRSGTNELVVTVANALGPPALWLRLEAGALRIGTDGQWHSSLAGATSQLAVPAGARRELQPGNLLFTSENFGAALGAVWPCLLLFGGFATLIWFAAHRWPRWPVALTLISLAWLGLIGHNATLLPADTMGYDTQEHLKYIGFIREHGRIPFADEGFQMFQPPLFYLLGAGLLSVLHLPLDSAGGLLALRLLCLAFGLAHVGCILLAARTLFPQDARARSVASIVAGLMPMLLLLSFYISNEAPMAAFTAGAIVLSLRMLVRNEINFGGCAALGLCLGAALLTKISALVAAPVIAFALGGRLLAQRARPFVWLRTLGVAFAISLIVSGWYYGLVWHRFGSPIVLSWDHAGGSAWWQETGYRTTEFFLQAGEVVSRPFNSGIDSFGDGLYTTLWGDGLWSGVSVRDFRPPWNYDLMIAGYALAVIPTGLLIFGAALTLWRWVRQPDAVSFLLLGCFGGFLAAIAFICLKAPYTASVKAFYGLAALIPLAVLATTGWMKLNQWRRGFGAASAMLTILAALNGVASFWLRRDAPATAVALALHEHSADRTAQASQRVAKAAQRHPQDARLALLHSQFLADAGQHAEARTWAERAVSLDPMDSLCLVQAAAEMRHAGEITQAIPRLRQAIELGSQSTRAYQDLALALMQAGQSAEALATARAGLATAPANRVSHRIVGSICLSLGQPTEAARHLQWALAFGEDTVVTRLLLASARLQLQQPAEAAEQLNEILRRQPDHPDALALLGSVESSQGRYPEAVAHFSAALKLAPESPELHNNLAWLRATCPVATFRDGKEAVRLAQLACRLTHEREPQFLGTLAAAHAEAGQFAEAIAVCREAIALAEAATNEPVAGRNRELLQLYLEEKPYREAVNQSAAP